MKKKTMLAPVAAFLLLLGACDSTRQQQDDTTETTTEEVGAAGEAATTANGISMEKNGLRLTSIDDSPKYPEARLRTTAPTNSANVEPGNVQFTYDITNYQLTKQTPDAEHKEHANSHEGQHIHHILDNEPYKALYEPEISREVPAGNHVLLSFLSRSYHESLKHEGAYDLISFSAGSPAEPNNFDPNGQHMFYSRPKGDYSGADAQKVMLDFYLVNTDLSENGNKVRATINGTEFMLTRWVPYSIEGLPMGETTIKLELLDQDGNVVPGPYNTVERTINLKSGS